MNLKLFVLGIWVSILGFLGCKPEKRIVSFSQYMYSDLDVCVKINDEVSLTRIKMVKSKTRLKSKTTTVIKSDVICETTNQDVLLILPRTKRIEKNLKTIRDRKPYVDAFESVLYNSKIELISLKGLLFEPDSSYKELGDFTVLRQVTN